MTPSNAQAKPVNSREARCLFFLILKDMKIVSSLKALLWVCMLRMPKEQAICVYHLRWLIAFEFECYICIMI